MSSNGLYLAPYSSPERARTKRKLILSVDDDLNVLYARYKLLAAAGYAVLSACDGVQALGIFGSEKVDLVLVDFMLPGMDGGLVAEAMKANKPHIPVVMISGVEVPEQSLSVCDGHLHKADGPEPLLRTIRELLNPAPIPVAERSEQVS